MLSAFAEQVVSLLVEIVKGNTPIDDAIIDREKNLQHKEILTGILTLQEDLQYANQQKEKAFKRIEESNRALQKAKQKAEAGAKAKIEFLSFISHEIRSPLHAVIGLTNILLTDNPRASQIKDLKALKLSAENVLSIINELLDLNKIEANMIDLEEDVFDIREIIFTTIRSFYHTAQEKQVKLEVEVSECVPEKVCGDPTRFAQILNNLVSNAVKFTHQGTIKVCVKLKRHLPGGVILLLTVSDTGIGIAKEKQSLIFERFVQADNKISKDYGGTGLGLAITRKLVKLFKGTIELESAINKGTTFFVTLRLKVP